MMQNRTSQAVQDFLDAKDGNEVTLDKIFRKFQKYEEALMQITTQCLTIHSAEAIADEALAFDPLSDNQ